MRKNQTARFEQNTLGPKFWACMNDRTPNPFVQNGKCTHEGKEFLEMTESVTLVTYEGLERRERVLGHKELMEAWLRGDTWVEDWFVKVRAKVLGHGRRA